MKTRKVQQQDALQVGVDQIYGDVALFEAYNTSASFEEDGDFIVVTVRSDFEVSRDDEEDYDYEDEEYDDEEYEDEDE
jgi:hypothetical protein